MNLHFLPFFRDIGETDMAFDGIVISNVVRDMKEKLIDGRIYKNISAGEGRAQHSNKE